MLDWAGTIVDFGSRAPVAALECVFAAAGVPVTVAEVRESMGLAKRRTFVRFSKSHACATLGS